MNYYERHIGDYLKDTAHLSLLEHGIYARLLDVYYTREGPIPAKEAARLVGAKSKDERDALLAVLGEFFVVAGDQYVQARCQREIERYAEGEPEREVKKANENNRLFKHRQERAALFKALTDAGHHAAWNIGIADLRALVHGIAGTTAPPLPATGAATPATATHTQSHSPYPSPGDKRTEPNGSGAGAPPSKQDVIFGYGIPLLTTSGVPDKQARSMLGLLRKNLQDDDAVINLLRRCAEERPLEPVAWLQAAAAAKPRDREAAQQEFNAKATAGAKRMLFGERLDA